ncbi:ATP-binding protein [bacterium]|nr:ATP-binding protein [bacterium]
MSITASTITRRKKYKLANFSLCTAKAGPTTATIESPESYANARDHFLDELRWLNRVLAAHVLRLRQANFYDGVKNFRSFFIADEEIDALIAAGIFDAGEKANPDEHAGHKTQLLQQARAMRRQIKTRVRASQSQHTISPLGRLASCFELSEFEQQALVICLAPQIDARYEKLYAYLQNDIAKRYPSIDLILALLCQNLEERLQHRTAFHPLAPLRYWGLIDQAEAEMGFSAGQSFLRPDLRLVHYVLGDLSLDHRVLPDLHILPASGWEDVAIPESLQQRLPKLLQRVMDEGNAHAPILHFHGRPGVGKKTLACALCSEIGKSLAVVDLRYLPKEPEHFRTKIRLIVRESLLLSFVVYFDHLDALESTENQVLVLLQTLVQEISELGLPTFLGGEKTLLELPDHVPIFSAEVPAPDFAARKAIWNAHLNGTFADNDRSRLGQLANQFDLTGGQIVRAVRRAKQSASTRDPENGRPTLADLVAGCRMQSQTQLDKLARKIEPIYVWNDLVLPEDVVAQLHEICQRVNHRHRVFSDWGFGRKLSQGKGINALFAGPSGTGKTMAAEIIANELQLDLYKIELSGVVSKYIGETEKNLDRIFSAAEHGNAILFFDEADALFGKRSEVRDAHDRYANIEISYLLQKMEQHEGITILATNLRQNLDDSLTRRLAFTIHFPFPDEASRRRIWKNIWPKEMPLAKDVSLDTFANQYKLSGGNIKNIALAAAFLAAEDGGIITEAHLLHAIRREYQKLGKHVSETDLASHFTKV